MDISPAERRIFLREQKNYIQTEARKIADSLSPEERRKIYEEEKALKPKTDSNSVSIKQILPTTPYKTSTPTGNKDQNVFKAVILLGVLFLVGIFIYNSQSSSTPSKTTATNPPAASQSSPVNTSPAASTSSNKPLSPVEQYYADMEVILNQYKAATNDLCTKMSLPEANDPLVGAEFVKQHNNDTKNIIARLSVMSVPLECLYSHNSLIDKLNGLILDKNSNINTFINLAHLNMIGDYLKTKQQLIKSWNMQTNVTISYYYSFRAQEKKNYYANRSH
ncbi:MAG: hypothetical protein HPY50_22140 [Firmicutes bacterium]|nr:hypothetical protein [Bacillota bacterium]